MATEEEANETFPVINVTREEYRAWKRAREYSEVDPKQGYLGKWVVDNFGAEALEVAQRGGYILRHGAEVHTIPRFTTPRVQHLTLEEIQQVEADIEAADNGTNV